MEVSDVRRRVLAAIEEARREAAARRARSDAAAQAYEEFLTARAIPVFQQVALALAAEGRRFSVETPARAVRLTSEASRDDFIEIALDDTQDPPAVLGRSNRGRGRRQIATERPVRDGADVAELTEEDVLAFAVAELIPLLER